MKIGRVFSNFQVDLKYTEHYLAKEFKKNGHHTTFVTSDKYLKSWKKYLKDKKTSGFYEYDDFDVYRLRCFAILEKPIFFNVAKLKKIIFHSDFDLLHLYGVGDINTIIILLLKRVAMQKTPPVLISDHSDRRTHKRKGFFARLYYNFFKSCHRFLKSEIYKIISFNPTGAALLSNRYGIKPSLFTIIPLGYDSDVFRFIPELKNREDEMVIGFAGKVSRKKRIDFLIRNLEELPFSENLKLIIAGVQDQSDAYISELINLAKQVSFKVEYRPFMTSIELVEFYNFIDLAVYPGGISITTIEASGSGTPVLIYESIEGLENRVSNGRGKLFKDVEGFATCMGYFYDLYVNNKIDNKKIEEATKSTVSWGTLAQKYNDIYQDALRANAEKAC